MKISVSNRQKDLSLREVKKTLLRIVPQIITLETGSEEIWSEVSFHFVTAKEISALHASYFNDPSITDCITFPIDNQYDTPPRVLGEVFVCPKVAILWAEQHGTDPVQETLLYIVHGLLHLLGYDDIQAKDRKTMRLKERTYMKLIKEHV